MKVECFPTDYSRVTWNRGYHGTITITFIDTGDSYYWFCGQWKLSTLTKAYRDMQAALLARADELKMAIEKAEKDLQP